MEDKNSYVAKGLTIRRNTDKEKGNFTQVPNEAINNKNLSLKAKGLLAVLLSKPSDWIYYKSNIEEMSTDGNSSTRSAFKELKLAGYYHRSRINRSKGKTGLQLFYLTIISEEPMSKEVANNLIESVQVRVNEIEIDTIEDLTQLELNTLFSESGIKLIYTADDSKLPISFDIDTTIRLINEAWRDNETQINPLEWNQNESILNRKYIRSLLENNIYETTPQSICDYIVETEAEYADNPLSKRLNLDIYLSYQQRQ